MPKIIVNAFLTLGGLMHAPSGPDEDREGGFPHGGGQAPCADEAMGRIVTQGFANYWPKVTDPDNTGKRLFGSGARPMAFEQVETVTSSKGATCDRLQRSGKPEYGQMGA